MRFLSLLVLGFMLGIPAFGVPSIRPSSFGSIPILSIDSPRESRIRVEEHLSQESRITELERKVAGMQKQITILHAKLDAAQKKK